MDIRNRVLIGNCLDVLKWLPADSVQCVVTSPPYWGLRDYGVPPSIWGGDPDCEHDFPEEAKSATCSKCQAWWGCFGLEPTPERYVENLVLICREVQRVLRPDGTFWLNIGDCYVGANNTDVGGNSNLGKPASVTAGSRVKAGWKGLAPKQLLMIPYRAALALQADGWWVRSDIIWSKSNPMPESVEDRPVRSHETFFLLAKSDRYFYDHIAVREDETASTTKRYENLADDGRINKGGAYREAFEQGNDGLLARSQTAVPRPPTDGKRNRRTVWHIPTRSYREAHFATFPPALPDICIRAGTSEKGACPACGAPWRRHEATWAPTCECGNTETVPCLVLDIFSGSGTTLMVAKQLRRDFVGIELNADYGKLIEDRTRGPLEEESARGVFDYMMSMGDDD